MSLYIVGGNINATAVLQNNWGTPVKLKMCRIYELVMPLRTLRTLEKPACVHQKIFRRISIEALYVIAKTGE